MFMSFIFQFVAGLLFLPAFITHVSSNKLPLIGIVALYLPAIAFLILSMIYAV